MEFFVPGNPTASAMFSLVWWWCVLHLQLPCLLYRLGFNLFLSLPSGKLVSVQCLPSNHLCDDQHPISELQCMENWSTQIPGSAPALYLMCLCAVGRCLFFSYHFPSVSFDLWIEIGKIRIESPVWYQISWCLPLLLPSSCDHLEVLRTSSTIPPGPVLLPPPPPPLPHPPSSSLATVDLFVQREL